MIRLPFVRQQHAHTCGAAVVLAIARAHGVGPATEAEVAADMAMTPDGSDPAQLVGALARYGLAVREHRGMTLDELIAYLDRGVPVIVMLQAWADPRPVSYADHWDDGHWVIAIGHAGDRIHFMDPMLDVRGTLTRSALLERWHDVEGPERAHVERYGLAVWRA
ncbi:MAG TPA: C39 family peptidase [Kofleriaceae bacterium]|nr:C39 family peptidase [Kofleriaceae bacterium]